MQQDQQPAPNSRCSATPHSDDLHEFYEGVTLSTHEVSYTIRPYPVGPTALISLGLVIVMLWTFFYSLTTSGVTSQRYLARQDADNAPKIAQTRWANNAETRQQISQQECETSGWEQDLRPALEQKVYVRGKLFLYHWQKSCPVLSPQPHTYQTHKPIVSSTRRRAEELNHMPCHYCSEIERKNQEYAGNAVNNQTLAIF